MSTETKKTWWETEFPRIEKEREKRALQYYEEREKNLLHYRLAIEEWSKKKEALSIGERLEKSFSEGFVFEVAEDYKPKKTRDDVERLKKQWLKDGVYDLWEIDGFEEYFFELRAFQFEELYRYISELSEKQTEYIFKLESKIEELEDLLFTQ